MTAPNAEYAPGDPVEFVMPKMLAGETDWWAGVGTVDHIRHDGLVVIRLNNGTTANRLRREVRRPAQIDSSEADNG